MNAIRLVLTGSLLIAGVARAQKITDDPKPGAPPADTIDLTNPNTKPEVPEVKIESPVDPTLLPNVAPAPEKAPMMPGLEKLPPDQREAVVRDIKSVSEYLRGGVRKQEALEKLNEIEKVLGESFLIENLRGAVYTRMRDFKSAREHFKKAISLAGNNEQARFHPRFNLAEIDFVEKQYDAARASFRELHAENAKKPKTQRDVTSEKLMLFKIMICDLKQKKEAEANAIFEKFDQFDADSPAWYYSKAVMSFIKDKKEEGEEWLQSAGRIYPREVNEVYNDSLIEMGWLDTLVN